MKNDALRTKESSTAHKTAVKESERKTIKDFYAMLEDWKGELIDGVLYTMDSPRVLHQALSFEIGLQLKDYVSKQNCDCFVMPLPLDTQLDCDEYTMLEPDISVTCDKSKIQKGILYGAPDLVMEVLSPSTAHKDCYLKLYKYMNAGVREYWIVNPKNKTVMVYDSNAENVPELYTFSDKIPVSIWNGDCKIDFPFIMEKIGFLYDSEHMFLSFYIEKSPNA
ncbi:MAG: Uma2 family endonuclease [Lachnospiraceae bacterium]|nr:Uma2 family endonuclease [Lachnospiraceae bacterium]